MNNTPANPATCEAPLISIANFAARWHVAPDVVSDIFAAGIHAFQDDGKLPEEACLHLHYVRDPR